MYTNWEQLGTGGLSCIPIGNHWEPLGMKFIGNGPKKFGKFPNSQLFPMKFQIFSPVSDVFKFHIFVLFRIMTTCTVVA